MQKETELQRGAIGPTESESRLLVLMSNLLARLDRSEAAKFKRQILKRNFSREPWVDLALSSIDQALEKGIIDQAERDSLIEAVRQKAAAQQGRGK